MGDSHQIAHTADDCSSVPLEKAQNELGENSSTDVSELESSISETLSYDGTVTDDVDAAIVAVVESLSSMDLDDPMRGAQLTSLGSKFHQRYFLTNSLQDLEHAVEFATEATQVSRDVHPHWNVCIYNLGVVLLAKYEHTKQRQDLNEAIRITQETVDSMSPHEIEYFAFVSNLRIMLEHKYSDTTSFDDLERLIQVRRDVVNSARDDEPELIWHLVNLAVRLKDKARIICSLECLDEGLGYLRQAIVLASDNDSYQQKCFQYIGIFLYIRYQLQEGAIDDLDESISIGRLVAKSTATNNPERAEILQSLSDRLWSKYLECEKRVGSSGSARRVDKAFDMALNEGRSAQGRSIDLEGSSSESPAETMLDSLLEESIRSMKQALKIGEPNGPTWGDRKYKLCKLLYTRYARGENLSDLLQSIKVAKSAIGATLEKVDRSERLIQLGKIMVAMFEKFGRISDIEEAIELGTEAVSNLPESGSEWPKYQSLVGVWLGYRYSKTGNMNNLEEGINLARRAARDLGLDHQHKIFCSMNLVNLLDKRVVNKGLLADADESICCLQEAIDATPLSNDERSIQLMELGWQLGQRHLRSDAEDDMQESIRITRLALEQMSTSSPFRAQAFHNLGYFLRNRYFATGESSDLFEGIDSLQKGLLISAKEDRIKTMLLSNLSELIRSRFLFTNNLEDLDESIRLARLSIVETPETAKNMAGYLGELGNTLRVRFMEVGDIEDMEEAVKVQKDALSKMPLNHLGRHGYLNNLALCFNHRYTYTGDLEDLNECIRLSQECVDTTPRSHKDWTDRLSNLGDWLRNRYHKIGRLSDLDEAIRIGYQITNEDALTSKHQDLYLGNLAVRLHDRYSRTNKNNDLEEAIRVSRESVNATGMDEGRKRMNLMNLGNWLFARYKLHRNEADYNEAYDIGRQGLENSATEDSERKSILNNLSAIIVYRYQNTNDLKDLDLAIEYCRKAIELSDPVREHLAGRLANLGNALGKRYIHTGDDKSLTEAISCFRKAIDHPIAAVDVKLLASRELMKYLARGLRWKEAFEVAYAAIELIPEMILKSLANTDKLHLLTQIRGVASDAASVALCAGEGPTVALRLLEQARGVLATSIQNLRADLVKLSNLYPDMADRFNLMKQKADHSYTQSSTEGNKTASQRNLDAEFEQTLRNIRKLPGCEDFLQAPGSFKLHEAAERGPIAVINVSQIGCDAVLIEKSEIHWLPLQRLTLAKIEEKAYEARKSPASPEILEWMWDDIVHPILDRLGFDKVPVDGKWPRVWWIPTGLLTHFPLHAAGYHMQGSSETALDRIISSYSTSIKTILLGRERHTPPSADENATAVLVAMELTPQHARLQFAPEELDEVRNICGEMKLATVEPPRQKQDIMKNLQDCTIFHFAGHGHTNVEDPSKSHLLLEDAEKDPFTVANLLELNHRRSPFLAYLSACGTGSIKDERLVDESIHLIGACQIAGFRHVIGTLWEVKDRQCVDMAKGIYEVVRDGGMSDESVSLGIHVSTRALRDEWLSGVDGSQGVRCVRNAVLVEDGEEESGPMNWAPYVHFGV